MANSAFPMRQVHLDFHTAPGIPDVGADWDPEHFVHTLTRAQVASVTLFAKCHHGMNYYPSAIGPVHPALAFDLLGEQIAACQRAGIRCPIYVSVGWDVSAAERHPEWRQVTKDGRLVGAGPLEPGWPWMCVNTAYADELIAQTEELLDRYPCDGFFYDILMYHADGCLCAECLAELRRAGGDPADAAQRRAHNNAVARRFMERASGVIRSRLPDAGIFYNSRWGLHFADERAFYSQIEIESLPTGGWGYGFYPLWSRYGRTFGMPMLGMTGRFHRSWADWGGLKHPDALRFECGGILATGGAVSIGDQLHPRGRLNEAVYEVIGAAFGDVAAVEAYCTGARAEAQIGLLALLPDADKASHDSSDGALEGAGKALLELHQQFDVITPATCADFGAYELLVIADRGIASPEVAERLRAFVAGGGKLLLSHEALLDSAAGNFLLAEEIGVDYVGPCASVPDYFMLGDSALHTAVTRPGFAYSFYDGPCARVAPRPGTATLADAYATYFNRTWEHFSSHAFTPPLAEPADYPAVTRRGGVIYIYGPVFAAYQKYGNLTFRTLVGGCLDLLLPVRLVATDAPASAEVSVMRQGERQIVHVVNYHASRRAPAHVEALETPVPLRDVALRLRRSEPTARVFLARAGADLPFSVDDGLVSVTVPRIDLHELIVFTSTLG
jgi:hypothetical protein